MLSSNYRSATLTRAVSDTFSGEKPCALCRKIETAKKEDASKRGKDGPEEARNPLKGAPEIPPLAVMELPEPVTCDVVQTPLLPPLGEDGLCAAVPLLQPPRI